MYLTPAVSASQVVPRNIITAVPPITDIVMFAFLILGTRKAGTPLAIASIPVRAEQPDANALRSRSTTAT